MYLFKYVKSLPSTAIVVMIGAEFAEKKQNVHGDVFWTTRYIVTYKVILYNSK